jgi:hypothetical protein
MDLECFNGLIELDYRLESLLHELLPISAKVIFSISIVEQQEILDFG